MQNKNLIQNLQSQSTWRLLGLGIITYGVYFAYYVQAQSEKINASIGEENRISPLLVDLIFVLSYVSAALFIAYMFVDEGHPVEALGGLADTVVGIMLIIWGFKARNRVNAHCGLNIASNNWFHGFWTFLFTPLYFNYKVNCILESEAGTATTVDI
jgi:drug/metabolite transporter (DMT)-like permease